MAFGWPDFGPLNQAAENIAMSKWSQAARAPVREQTGGKVGGERTHALALRQACT